jgi:hypothetical protein
MPPCQPPRPELDDADFVIHRLEEYKNATDHDYSFWDVIIAMSNMGVTVERRHIIALLRRGEPVPPKAQDFIAKLLEGSDKGRGRPKVLSVVKEIERSRKARAFLAEIDGIRSHPRASGKSITLAAAFEQYANSHNDKPESVERRYRAARKEKQRYDAEMEEALKTAASYDGQTLEEFKARLLRSMARFSDK